MNHFVILLLCLFATAVQAEGTCTSIAQEDAILWKSLDKISSFVTIDVKGTYTSVSKYASMLPTSAQTCFGSVKLDDHFGALFGIIGSTKCQAVISKFKSDDRVNIQAKIEKLIQDINNSADMLAKVSVANNFLTSIISIPGNVFDTQCDFLKNQLSGCLTETVIPVLEGMIKKTSCCDDMDSKGQVLFGSSAKEFLTKAVGHLKDMVCSNQSDGQTCAYSFVHSYIPTSPANVFESLPMVMSSVQVPNNQGCKAFKGQEFTSTTGSTTSIGFKEGKTVGKCIQPVSTFNVWAASLPFVKDVQVNNAVPLTDLFTSGKCIKVENMYPYIESKIPAATMGLVKSITSGMCFHVATGIEAGCF